MDYDDNENEDYNSENEEYLDSDEELDEEDPLVNEGFDQSGKIILKSQEEENELEADIKGDNDIDDGELELNLSLNKRKYAIYNFVTEYEYCALIGQMAELISNSKVIIPPECYDLFLVETGNSITIATQWVNNCHKYHLPLSIIRKINNIKQIIKPHELIFSYSFNMFQNNSVNNENFFNNFR